MNDEPEITETETRQEPSENPVPTLHSESLFGGERTIWIIHNGERYLLRITRKNKLILQK